MSVSELDFSFITRVDIIDREPGWTDESGAEHVDPESLVWHSIPWFAESGTECYDSEEDLCHGTTMCPECFGSWANDHWIRVYEGDTLKLDTQQIAFRLAAIQDGQDPDSTMMGDTN